MYCLMLFNYLIDQNNNVFHALASFGIRLEICQAINLSSHCLNLISLKNACQLTTIYLPSFPENCFRSKVFAQVTTWPTVLPKPPQLKAKGLLYRRYIRLGLVDRQGYG